MTILDQILAEKKIEIAKIPTSITSLSDIKKNTSFLTKLLVPKLHLIAEVKRASPSKGEIYADFDHQRLAKKFESAGASCISVLTDEQFFKGHKQFLIDIKSMVNIPVLRKDFIIDPIQVYESKHMGADVILVILDILSIQQANEIIDCATDLMMDVLIEVHDIEMIDKLEELTSMTMVGINNRNLTTFDVDTNHVLNMQSMIQDINSEVKIIAESGYNSVAQLDVLSHHGVNGVLIGEGLHKNPDVLEWFNK